jgi:hypothetical protein
MGTQIDPETSVVFKELTRLMPWEDFINISRRERITSYIITK